MSRRVRRGSKTFRVTGNLLVYNEMKYIRQVVDNLLSFCDELVIIDGGSTDGTTEYILSLQDPRIKLYVWPQDTPYSKGWREADRRTLAMRLSEGDYIFRLDADELMDDRITDVIANLVDKKTIGAFPGYHFFGDFSTIRLNTSDDKVWYPNPRICLFPNDPHFFYASKDPRGLHCKLYKKLGPFRILVTPKYAYWPRLGQTIMGRLMQKLIKKIAEVILGGVSIKYYEDVHFFHYHYAVGYKASDLRASDDAKRTIRYAENFEDSLKYGKGTILLKKIEVKHPKAFRLRKDCENEDE